MLSAMGAESLSDLAVLTLTEIGTTTPTKQSKTFLPRKCFDWSSNFEHLHRITET